MISGPNQASKNSTVFYSVGSSGSFTWTVTGGSITSGQGTSTIVVLWGTGSSGTVNVTGGSEELDITLHDSVQ